MSDSELLLSRSTDSDCILGHRTNILLERSACDLKAFSDFVSVTCLESDEDVDTFDKAACFTTNQSWSSSCFFSSFIFSRCFYFFCDIFTYKVEEFEHFHLGVYVKTTIRPTTVSP